MNHKDKAILIVDDDPSIRFMLSEALKKEGYKVETASSGPEAIKKVKQHDFLVLIMDVRMPKMNGIEALLQINRIDPQIYPIILTAYGKENLEIEEIKKLAFSYFTKPIDLVQLRLVIHQAIERSRLEEEESLGAFPCKEMVGDGPAITRVHKVILKVAKANVNVLILGESGTGKELVAKAVCVCSQRKNKPFIPITCSAIPDTLLESELFGYEQGAFTDAKGTKPGKFELADGGIIFLDEIGDMSLALQAKLLRVLEEKKIERLGATNYLSVDVRILAATNKDLFTEVQEKRFREDLYYRLNVISIYLPPLRERREDIPLLLEHFINKFNQELNRQTADVSIEALELLINYPWPGNIRELENVLKRAMVLQTGNTLTTETLSSLVRQTGSKKNGEIELSELDQSQGLTKTLKSAAVKIERKIIERVLLKNNGNRNLTAKELGISRKTLYNKIKGYDLE